MRGVTLILASVLLGASGVASASVLATSPQIPFKFDCGTTGFPDAPHPADCSFQICYMDPDPASGLLVPLTDTTLFDPVSFFPHDRLPAVYTVTGGKRFEAFAAKFTDGIFESLSGQAVFYSLSDGAAMQGPSTTFSESWLLSPRPTDFAGYKLTAITVTTYIDDITPDVQFPRPLEPYQVTGHAIVTFEGTPIPEPAALTALAGSLMLLGRLRRCH